MSVFLARCNSAYGGHLGGAMPAPKQALRCRLIGGLVLIMGLADEQLRYSGSHAATL
jgi:hypothetical protein